MKSLVLLVTLFCLSPINSFAIERFDQYPVKGYNLINPDVFNEIIHKASSKNNVWTKNPLLIAIKYLDNPNYRFISILREDNSAELPTKSKITFVLEGFLDDEIRGSWYQFFFKISKDRTYWEVTEIHKANLGGRMDSLKEFTK